MDAKINIAKILKDKPQGTKLYSSACGKCELKEADDKSFKVSFYSSKFGFMNGGEGTFDKNGNLYDDGECVVFPSKEMRNWSKFAWKKGDILVHTDGTVHIIFEGFEDDTYRTFKGKYYLWEDNDHIEQFDDHVHCMETSVFIKANDDAQTYINTIEERLGGKLNMDTLEIESVQPEFKDGDIVYVESDGFHYPSIHILNINGDTKRYYARLVICGRYDESIDYDIPAFDIKNPNRLRLATEAEKKQLFDALAKEGKAWDAKKKQFVDLKPKVELKPFDKVLIRDDEDHPWRVSLFGYKDANSYYCCNGCTWNQCIPYEGNEHLLGTTKDVEG